MQKLIGVVVCALAAWVVGCGDDRVGNTGNEGGKGGSAAGNGGASAAGNGDASAAGNGDAASGGASAGNGGGTSGGRAASSNGGQGGSGGLVAGGSGGLGELGGGEGGSGEFDRWADCPSSATFEGEPSWPDTIEVTEGAVYCATFDESRTLKEELANKALLRVAPGSYRLPAAERDGLALPVCIAFGEHERGIALVPKSTTHQTNPFQTSVSHHYTFTYNQVEPVRQLTASVHLLLPQEQAPNFVLDGNASDPFGPREATNSFLLCDGLASSCYPRRLFDSCTHSSSRLNQHQIELADGSTLTLDVRIGESGASTEPGAFVAARGAFRGVVFEQTNYFKLIYRPTHHHFGRDFAVLFDQPIDGACGLQILHFSTDANDPVPTAATVDCELDTIESMTVRSATLTR